MSRAFVGLGSNEGDRLALISHAIRSLGSQPGVQVVQMAMISETAPVGPPQGPYLNTAVELETTRTPRELFVLLKAIERGLGRPSDGPRWGPRLIDLDLLFFEDRVIAEPDLCVPHPRAHDRRFVLEPLHQLAPDLVHPVLKQPITKLLARLSQPADVELSAVAPPN